MNRFYLISVLALGIGMLVSMPASAGDFECVGGIQSDNGILTCVIETRIDQTDDGVSLAEQTFGIVLAVNINAKLTVDSTRILEYLQDNMISVPEQTVSAVIETNGSPIHLNITLAPIVYLNDEGVAYAASANITSVTGNLPNWLNNYLKNMINSSDEVEAALIDATNTLLETL